jgi:hypothetical protein
MITMQDKKRSRGMSFDDAKVIIRRKPQNAAEFNVVRIALITLSRGGMDQAAIEAEARRGLSYPEELVLAEFEE